MSLIVEIVQRTKKAKGIKEQAELELFKIIKPVIDAKLRVMADLGQTQFRYYTTDLAHLVNSDHKEFIGIGISPEAVLVLALKHYHSEGFDAYYQEADECLLINWQG